MQSLAKASSDQPIAETWLSECLFWAHFLVIIGGVLMGLVLPWQLAISLIILHRLHLRLFDGCVFSQLQKQVGVLDHSDDYLRQLAKRLFNYKLNSRHVKAVDRSIISLSIAIIVAANFNLSHIVIIVLVALISLFGAVACWLMLRSQRCALTSERVCQVKTQATCDSLKSSRFSKVFGLPVEYLGFGYFVALILAELLRLTNPSSILTVIHALLLMAGLITTIAFITIQARVLKTLCKSCLNVHGASLSVLLVQATRIVS